MLIFTGRNRNFKLVATAIAVTCGILIANVGLTRAEGEAKTIQRYHQLGTVKSFDAGLINSGCAAEMAAYAAALASLEAAEQAAEDAYNAWLDCEYGRAPAGVTESKFKFKQPAPTHSILERD